MRHTVQQLVPVARLGYDLVHGVWARDAVILSPLPTLGAPHFAVKFINFPEFAVNIIKFCVSGVNTVVTRSRSWGFDLTEGVRGTGERAGECGEETILSSWDCCWLLLFHSKSLDS